MHFKKYIVLAALVGAVTYMISFQNKKTEVFEASSHAGGNYCLAIRGNGELEPAHWGAVSHVIEQWGLPSAMAGGSSGSISMFLLNAVAQNPFISDESLEPSEKNRRAALTIKSFLGFFNELKETKFSQDFFKLYGEFKKQKAEAATKQMSAELLQKNYAVVLSILQQGMSEGVFDLVSMKPLVAALQNPNEARAKFYMQQLNESVQMFGKFDANTDANLFFRPGLINFTNAAESFGRWASFYALPTHDETILDAWANFYKECTAESENKSWIGLMQQKPECGQHFHRVFEAYFKNEPQAHFENTEIGKPIAVYPSTAVLVGTAAEQTVKAFAEYDQNLDAQFGAKFKIENPEEVRFGYWGQDEALKQIESRLDKTDEKSRRFTGLGPAKWKQVLGLSPAEPGLSPLIPFTTAHGEKMVSAGGWSDLLPIGVLKAAGCDHVVYVTRTGGESLFAQGVANRLMSLGRDIAKMNPQLNDAGDPTADPGNTWSRLYNMANPKSSENNSLAQASAVVCTNWNDFDVKTNLLGLIEDAYRSPYWVPAKLDKDVPLMPRLTAAKMGCQPFEQN